MMSNKNSKNLYRFVESKIICGGYGVGEKLPALRRLADRFSISLSSAQRTLMLLAKRGFVELRHGSGCYVVEHRKVDSGGIISVVSVPFTGAREQNLTGIAINGVNLRIQDLGLKIRHHSFHAMEFNDAVLNSITKKSDGTILLGGYDAVLKNPRPRTPMVGLVMHNTYGGLFSTVDLDPVRSAELAVDFFRSKNKKDIRLIVPDRQNYYFREQIFRSMWNAPGEVCSRIIFPVTEFDKNCGYLYMFGVPAYGDALNYHRRHDRILTNEHTVLCMDGRPMFDYHSVTAMPTIALNWRQAGIAATDELLRRLSRPGSSARRIYMNTELYLG